MKKNILFFLLFSISYSCCNCREENKSKNIKNIYCPNCKGTGSVFAPCNVCYGEGKYEWLGEYKECSCFSGKAQNTCGICFGKGQVPEFPTSN